MKAIVVHPGQPQSIHMRDVPDPALKPDQVAVKVLRVGLCGTDMEINEGLYGQAPEGLDYLILGHENFGVVEEVGKKAKGFQPGNFVVATVRRPCGRCYNCAHGEDDLCTSGAYTERGIKGRHGFMAEYYVESPQYLNKIPRAAKEIGVLLEPMSVVEKGIDHAFRIQKRMLWKPRLAVVLGAGPVGLLAAAVLRNRGLRTVVVGREPQSDPRAQIVPQMQAEYFSVEKGSLNGLPKHFGPLDLVVEATGSSTVAFAAMQSLAPNGILCLLSVTGGDKTVLEPTDQINQDLVLRNNVVFGSVNANPRHFRMGVRDLAASKRSTRTSSRSSLPSDCRGPSTRSGSQSAARGSRRRSKSAASVMSQKSLAIVCCLQGQRGLCQEHMDAGYKPALLAEARLIWGTYVRAKALTP